MQCDVSVSVFLLLNIIIDIDHYYFSKNKIIHLVWWSLYIANKVQIVHYYIQIYLDYRVCLPSTSCDTLFRLSVSERPGLFLWLSSPTPAFCFCLPPRSYPLELLCGSVWLPCQAEYYTLVQRNLAFFVLNSEKTFYELMRMIVDVLRKQNPFSFNRVQWLWQGVQLNTNTTTKSGKFCLYTLSKV